MDEAVAANTVGYNVSRAVGPALGGLAIAWAGVTLPLRLYAISNIIVLAALLSVATAAARDEHPARRTLDGRFGRAFECAAQSASPFDTRQDPRLLPFCKRLLGTVAAHRARPARAGGATFYGLLLGSIGVGAIVEFRRSFLNSRRGWAPIGSSPRRLWVRLCRSYCSGLPAIPGRILPPAFSRARCEPGNIYALCLRAGRVAGLGKGTRLAIFLTFIFGDHYFCQRALGAGRGVARH